MTLNLYQAGAAASLNEVVYRTKQDQTVSLANNRTAFLLRRYHANVDGTTFDGWRVWTCTNKSGSSTTLDVSASEEEPVYYVTYDDANVHFDVSIGLLDTEGFLHIIMGGNGGTGTGARYENWTFFPESEWDFSPFTNAVDARLDA